MVSRRLGHASARPGAMPIAAEFDDGVNTNRSHAPLMSAVALSGHHLERDANSLGHASRAYGSAHREALRQLSGLQRSASAA